MMATTYTKLRDGSWGIRSTETLTAGRGVTVVKKSGECKTETVGKILFAKEGISIATIATTCTERQYDAGYGRGRKVRSACCGYPCPVTGRRCTPDDPCHDCH